MSPRKFFGATSREVLAKVRQALGDDALIVSNRPVNGGIEITALSADALTAAQAVSADAVAASAQARAMHADLFNASRASAADPVAAPRPAAAQAPAPARAPRAEPMATEYAAQAEEQVRAEVLAVVGLDREAVHPPGVHVAAQGEADRALQARQGQVAAREQGAARAHQG